MKEYKGFAVPHEGIICEVHSNCGDMDCDKCIFTDVEPNRLALTEYIMTHKVPLKNEVIIKLTFRYKAQWTQEVTQSINSCLRYRPIGSSEDFKPLPERECEG